MKLEAIKCSCGHPTCTTYIVAPLFGCQCSGLQKEEAEELVRRYNAFEDKLTAKELNAAKTHLGQAIQEADHWKGGLMPEDYAEHDAKIAKYRRALYYILLRCQS